MHRIALDFIQYASVLCHSGRSFKLLGRIGHLPSPTIFNPTSLIAWQPRPIGRPSQEIGKRRIHRKSEVICFHQELSNTDTNIAMPLPPTSSHQPEALARFATPRPHQLALTKFTPTRSVSEAPATPPGQETQSELTLSQTTHYATPTMLFSIAGVKKETIHCRWTNAIRSPQSGTPCIFWPVPI
jgi:hypothetical protein